MFLELLFLRSFSFSSSHLLLRSGIILSSNSNSDWFQISNFKCSIFPDKLLISNKQNNFLMKDLFTIIYRINAVTNKYVRVRTKMHDKYPIVWSRSFGHSGRYCLHSIEIVNIQVLAIRFWPQWWKSNIYSVLVKLFEHSVSNSITDNEDKIKFIAVI